MNVWRWQLMGHRTIVEWWIRGKSIIMFEASGQVWTMVVFPRGISCFHASPLHILPWEKIGSCTFSCWTFLYFWNSQKKKEKKREREPILQCKGCGFDPWSGNIPHASEPPSLGTTTAKPMSCKYWSLNAWSLCSETRETTKMRSWRAATRQ